MMRPNHNETGMRASALQSRVCLREESMHARLARAFLAGAFCMVSAAACAHEDATQEPLPFLDCDHPPEHALNSVPEPVARWAQLQCIPAGQMLVPGDDWVWRYPGSFTDRPFVPAWMSADASASAGPRYFQAMNVRQAGADEMRELKQRFARSAIELPAPRAQTAAPERIYVLAAESNLGEKLEVHFVYRSDEDIWAVPCARVCAPEQLFHIYRRD
jgi:hypothetical protein